MALRLQAPQKNADRQQSNLTLSQFALHEGSSLAALRKLLCAGAFQHSLFVLHSTAASRTAAAKGFSHRLRRLTRAKLDDQFRNVVREHR